MQLRLPDWLFYFLIVFLIYVNASRGHPGLENSVPPPDLGPLLPGEMPTDQILRVDMSDPKSGIGTAFSIDHEGSWLTARHVIDGCDEVGLNLGRGRIIKVESDVSRHVDIGVLKTQWQRNPITSDLYNQRQIGEHGYFIGYPQGKPGEAIGQLIGRHKMRIRGRYRTEEAVLAWAELGRTRGLKGSLGGMSGGPVLDADGEVIGIVAAESPRRGRIYSVAPKSMRAFMPKPETSDTNALKDNTFGLYADKLRRERRIAQVMCAVDDS